MSESSQLTVRPKASTQLASLLGMQPEAMLDTIKAQCFKTNPANVSDAQLAAFVSIAADMGVNPLLPGMLYAYPIQGGGIIPIMGPDGIYKKLCEHPDIDSWETEVFPVDTTLAPTHAVTKIWRKGRERPLAYTALFSEWKIQTNPNWVTRPRHMLALRSLKHCARQLIHGIPGDEDDRHIQQEINVTPGAENAPVVEQQKRSDPPARAKKGANAAADDGKTINVETVPPKPPVVTPDPAAVAAEKAKAVQAEKELAAEKAAALKAPATSTGVDEPKPVEKIAEKVADKPKTPAATGGRTSLKEGEEIQARAKVLAVFAMNINVEGVQTPSVHAKVEGEYTGPVYHFGAAKAGAEGLVPNDPAWVVGNEVVLSLFGRVNKKTPTVIARVDKVEAAEGQPNTAEVDV